MERWCRRSPVIVGLGGGGARQREVDRTLCVRWRGGAIIVRSSEGVLRRVKNLCLGAMFEAVRDRIKTVDLKQVNLVLLQPHWRKDPDLPQ